MCDEVTLKIIEHRFLNGAEQLNNDVVLPDFKWLNQQLVFRLKFLSLLREIQPHQVQLFWCKWFIHRQAWLPTPVFLDPLQVFLLTDH